MTRIFDEHTVFALEAYEIVLFAVYWVAQTIDNWNEGISEPKQARPVTYGD